MVRKAALGIVALISAAGAHAQTGQSFRAEVEREKAELVALADKAFMDAMQRNPETFSKMGLSYGQARNLTVWLAMSTSLGACYEDGGQEAIPVWLNASDYFGAPTPSLQKRGLQNVDDARQENILGKLSPAKRAAYCKVEVTAIREILLERFGVR